MPESEKASTPSVSPVQRLWRYGGITRAGQSERDQAYVLKVYSAVGFVALTIFGFLHIFVEGDGLVGWLELGFGVVIALNALGFRFSHNLPIARLYFIVSIMAVILTLLITGGTRDTGIFWLFVFPNVAFFLAGKRKGVWWLVSLGIAIGIVATLAQFSIIDIPYSIITIRQVLITLAVVTFGVYVYQSSRERALQQVHESRRDLQEYLDHMTTFSVKISLSGAIILANKAAKEASGLGEQLLGTSFLEAPWWSFDTGVQRRVEAAFYKVLTGQSVNYDEKFKAVSTKGPTLLTVNFSMIPIVDKNRRLLYVLAEARDISAEQEIDRAKSAFIGLASHELQGPVAASLHLSGKLLTGDSRRLTEEQRQDIRELYRNSQHLSTLINDMLLVSQLELNGLTLKLRRANIVDLSQTIVTGIKPSLLSGRKLEIQEDYAAHVPEMLIDPEALRIVLDNLISNAVKYTPDTGRVYVRIRRIDETLHSDSKGSVQIEVQDSGVGIPQADQKKIFTKFFRASNNQSKASEGTGLGLYIVKMLVEYLGGSIAFQSEENVGSIFIVTLPIEGMQKTDTRP